MQFIIGLIILISIYVIWRKGIRIDFKSFFKKGFRKLDNKFGIVCVTAKQRYG